MSGNGFLGSTSGSWAKEIGKSRAAAKELSTSYARKIAEQEEKGGGFSYGYDSMAQTVSSSPWEAAASAQGVSTPTDAIGPATGNMFSTNTQTGGMQLNTDLYGAAAEPERGMTFTDMASSVFSSLGEASSFGVSAPAAPAASGGFGWGQSGGTQAASPRLDMYGNEIRSDGLNDYVEMNGQRYNIDFAGNYRACDLAGNEIQAQAAGFGADAGNIWGSSGSMYGTVGSESGASLYGYSAPDTGAASIYGTAPAADTGSIYGSGWGTPEASTASFYGTAPAADTGSIYGSGWGTPEASPASFYGTAPAADTGSVYGSGWGAPQDTGSSFWGTPATTQAEASSFYGSAPTPPAENTSSWWGGSDSAARTAEREAQNGFYSSNSGFWSDDNKYNSGW